METPVLKEVALPGAEIVDRIRRLIIVALVAGVSYSVLTAAGKALIPITEWGGTGTFFYPFPFGAVDMVATP